MGGVYRSGRAVDYYWSELLTPHICSTQWSQPPQRMVYHHCIFIWDLLWEGRVLFVQLVLPLLLPTLYGNCYPTVMTWPIGNACWGNDALSQVPGSFISISYLFSGYGDGFIGPILTGGNQISTWNGVFARCQIFVQNRCLNQHQYIISHPFASFFFFTSFYDGFPLQIIIINVFQKNKRICVYKLAWRCQDWYFKCLLEYHTIHLAKLNGRMYVLFNHLLTSLLSGA